MNQLKVFFEMTDKCNYKCIYCFSPVKYNSESKILSMYKFKTIMNNLSLEKKDISVLLEGGEPLFINNICDYGKYAKKFAYKVALGTNASLVPTLTQEKIDTIKNTFDEISIGFDTINPDIFKKLTNIPIFPSLKGINILLENKIPIKICTVVTKYNADFKEIVKFCESKNIKKLRFYWFIQRPNNDNSLLPSEIQYNNFINDLNEYKGNIDIKLNRYYTPYGNIVVSSKGEISIATDKERKNLELIGNYNNFINKLKFYV